MAKFEAVVLDLETYKTYFLLLVKNMCMWEKFGKSGFYVRLIQGPAKEWFPGCENFSGKARQKW